MEEIPGLAHLRANSEVIEEVDNDGELVVTTFAHYEGDMLSRMRNFGWVIRAPNMFVWKRFPYEDINIEPEITY
jgi:hypothetical protein